MRPVLPKVKHLYRLAWLLMLIAMGCSSGNYERTETGLKTRVDSTLIEIQFFTPKIVRVLKYPLDAPPEKKSLSVIKKPEPVSLRIQEDDEVLSLVSSELKVVLNTKTGTIAYSTPEGRTLINEKDGSTAFVPFDDNGDQTYSVKQTWNLEPDEAIYGLGILQNGKMSQRRQKVRMIQNNTWDYVPFIQSVKGYGIFWDNYSPTTFTDDESGTEFLSEVGDCIDYYFMYGEHADGVITNMRELTGEVPMFPLWTYGFWQSKERYKSQNETVSIVKKYRELGVPLDGIIQDWQYWGDNYHWNAMEFLNPEFPEPQKFVDDVHALNAHMIISIWSSFGPETKQYKEFNEKGMLMNFLTWPLSGKDVWPPDMNYPSGVRVYDPYHPEARDIYWRYLKGGLFSLGIDGWWMDSTEPDHMNFKPEDLNNQTYLGSFRKVRNAYPLMTVGGVYDHQRKESSDKRVFILTRSAFAGQQRYGANTWSGDVVASWKALRNQISAGLNFSLCGIPHWNSDIGGFFLWDYKRKLDDPEYRELYARWLQFGAFCPMMRSHGADAPREIFQFGKKGDAVYDALEKFIHLRYRLLPYIYSSSWDVSANHSSMMRALVMDFPTDRNAIDINDQYMFGESLLVSPVTNAMYVKQKVSGKDTIMVEDFSVLKSKETYLPANTGWYDFWTGERFTGGTKVSKETPLDVIPLYVKAGSIIPIGPAVQYAEEKKWDDLEIRVYPGANGSFVLYEDEFDNYNYEKEVYSTITFTWDDAKRTLTIDDRKGSFLGMLSSRTFQLTIVNANKGGHEHKPSNPDRAVTYTGKRMQVKL
ncbi:MAG: DUF5110 domain-containing protein [Cyclobacteriaceae bacterium]|nr:DUF5110 domain-containing protein [Cyclobacteriaceae bacterium]